MDIIKIACALISIINAEKSIFDKLINCINKVLVRLDGDTRTNIYIGVTGILVAIIIFIAESLSGKKNEIYKRLILKKTDIVKSVALMISILAMIWISNIVSIECSYMLYNILQLTINCLIFYSMFNTLNLFRTALKLNTDEKYLNEELDEYISNQIIEFNHNKNIKVKKYTGRQDEFLKYINRSKVFQYQEFMFDFENEYTIIYPSQNGYIIGIENEVIKHVENEIENNIEVSNSDNVKENSKKEVEIILVKKIGEKVNRNFPLAYCRNLNEKLIEDVKKIIITDKNDMYFSESIIKILDDIFQIAEENKLNYDANNRILNLYENLCYKKNDDIIGMLFDIIKDKYKNMFKSNENIESFSDFLLRLSYISYKYRRYDDFKELNYYISVYYFNRIEKTDDLKMLAKEYANNVLNSRLYSAKKKMDYIYYENILANALNLINGLMCHKNIEAVNVLFDNIYIDNHNYIYNNKFNEIDIINFQFIIGVIYSFLYADKNSKLEEKYHIIKEIVEKIKDDFFDFYDIWDLIYKFLLYSKKSSEMLKTLESFDIIYEENKYANSWVNQPIDINEVLRCMIYMFKVNYADINNINENDININDKYKFEKIKEILNKSNFPNVEKNFLNGDYNFELAKNVLEKAIQISTLKEEKYIQEEKLQENKLKEFKEIVINEANKINGLLEILNEINKVKYSKEKLKKVIGINELIPREIFFENGNGFDLFAKDYGESLIRGINKKLIEFIRYYGDYEDRNLEEFLENTQYKDNYIIFISPQDFYSLKYTKEENCFIYQKEKINVIIDNIIDKIKIINKKDLPLVKFCEFDDTFNPNNVNNNIYFELIDCSNNETLRNEIINRSEWLKEKGNLQEQHEYLKKYCILKIFISCRIIKDEEN